VRIRHASTKIFNVDAKQKTRYSGNLATGMTIDNNLARMEKERETFSFECQNHARFPAGLRQITFIVGRLVRRLRNLGQFLKRRINEVRYPCRETFRT